MKVIFPFLCAVFVLLSISGCYSCKYKNIAGVSLEQNERLKKFFEKTSIYKKRKVAVFDCDGTVLSERPRPLACEAFSSYAQSHPGFKKEVVQRLKSEKTSLISCLRARQIYWGGLSVESVENLGFECWKKSYKGKFFHVMTQLLDNLKDNGFEIWIITASPEILYQKFLSEKLGIPKNRVLGVNSLVKRGIISEILIPPIPYSSGKRFAIETFIKAKPLLAAGNTMGDLEMISFSSDMKIVVNPDNSKKLERLGNRTLAEHAKAAGWLIIKCEP